MTVVKRPVVAGNWKMNLTIEQARELARAILEKQGEVAGADLAVFPVFTALADVSRVLAGSTVKLGGQDLFREDSGAFTGEISGPMLKDAGCGMALVGHSERRHVIGETDDIVAGKLRAALRSGLDPVLCVGETLPERESGRTMEVIERQLASALDDLFPEEQAKVMIAYEPVWAIGTGKTASPTQAQEVHAHIRNFISRKYGKEFASRVIILYGGSVKPDNAFSLFGEKDVDGFLVGGASLKVDAFIGIAGEALRAIKD